MSNKNKNTSKQKPKNLTITKIKNEAVKTRKMEEYIINSDGDIIKFYPTFPQGKIDELLEELRKDIIYANDNDIELTHDDNFFISYIMFLSVKHFTSLKNSISDKLENKIQIFEHMKDSGYFNIIVDEVFLPSELSKVIESLSKVLGTQRFMEQIETKSNDYLETLKFRNQQLMDDLDNQIEEKEGKLKN